MAGNRRPTNDIDCEELPQKWPRKQLKSLWVKMKDSISKGHLVAGVHHRPPDHNEPVDFLLQIQNSPHSQALILMEDFNHLHVCWESGTADCKQSRRLLKCVRTTSWSILVLDKPTGEAVLLDLVLTSVDELIREIKTGVSLGCRDHTLVK